MGVQHKFKNPQTLREYLYNLTVDKLRTFEPFIPARDNLSSNDGRRWFEEPLATAK